MDKLADAKRAVNSTELKPVERFLKRYDTLVSKDFSSRRSDAREQIIEEQIEEYKKKREKILGNQSTVTIVANEARKETEEASSPTRTDDEIVILKEISEENVKEEITKEDDKMEVTQEKAYDNTEEYLARLSKLKQKWEEAKRKKESLQKELDESSTEGDLEKLARILGEKEKNLQVIL